MHIHAHAGSQKKHEGTRERRPAAPRSAATPCWVSSTACSGAVRSWSGSPAAPSGATTTTTPTTPTIAAGQAGSGRPIAGPDRHGQRSGMSGPTTATSAGWPPTGACPPWPRTSTRRPWNKLAAMPTRARTQPAAPGDGSDQPQPGPGLGPRERDSFAGARARRARVLALALIHHLAISNNVPLDRLADFFASAGEHLIIEFVPKSDSQVQRLLATREDVFPDLPPGRVSSRPSADCSRSWKRRISKAASGPYT